MKSKALALLWVAVAWLVLGQAVAAQAVVNVKLDSVDVSQFPRLTAYATVIDDNGLPVSGLAADHFELVEDGQASFAPEQVEAIANDKAAVSILILIDLSETMNGEPLQAAKQATAQFLDRLLNEGNDPDRAAFIGFGREVDIKAVTLTEGAREVPFTNDMGRLLNVVNFLEVDQKSGTPLYDAVYRAVRIAAGQPGRRAIIVMTDGSDVGSTLKQDDPINEARRQHVPIFPIGLSNSRLDKTYLARLAELTGGQFQEAPTPDELGAKFEEVLSQLKIQYVLSYQSRLPEADGQLHSLLLRVNTPRGQAFDEVKFQVGQAPAAPSATPRPGETAVPTPAATPVPGDKEMGLIDRVMSWVSQNPLLAAAIAGTALLLLLMVIVFVVLLIRRRSPVEEAAWDEAAPAPWPAEQLQAGVDFGGVPTRPTPTVGPAVPAPPLAGTEVAPKVSPGQAMPERVPPPLAAFSPPPPPQAAPERVPPAPAPAPSGAPPPPAKVEAGEPAAGRTLLIERKPKIKVVGFLVDRKKPSRRFDVDKRTVTIGRAPGNTIVLDHPTVSRQHATIKLEDGVFRLYDLGSANGTYVADKRVREPVALEDGMTVRFGELEFTFKRMSLE